MEQCKETFRLRFLILLQGLRVRFYNACRVFVIPLSFNKLLVDTIAGYFEASTNLLQIMGYNNWIDLQLSGSAPHRL